MILWARLTWQARDPEALAADLARRLEVPARPGGLVPGARLLDLGTAELEVRPWIREGPEDHPRAAGRLLLEPVPDGEPAPELRPGVTPPALSLVGLGWATVELDRAEAELGMWLGPRPAAPPDGVPADADGRLPDEALGAWARLRQGGGLPGAWTVLLEPATEGRTAASLARDGEGPCALYLRAAAGLAAWRAAARERGIAAGAPRPGPFGDQVLLAAGPTGPHLVVTEGRAPVPGGEPPGTIAP